MIDHDEVKAALSNGAVEILFTKKNGEERRMKCTRNVGMIPEENHPVGSPVVYSDEAYRVFDLEKMEWRSFRWDSLLEYKQLE